MAGLLGAAVGAVEEWREIPGWEGLYSVSNLGNVKSISRVVERQNNVPKRVSERILKPTINKNGYLYVGFKRNGFGTSYAVHQLVCMAFLNHIPNKFDVVINHKNGIKTDNHVNNLELTTNRKNTADGFMRFPKTSKYTGVHLYDNKWCASIQHNSKTVYLGAFDDEISAKNAYEDAVYSIENGLEIKRHISRHKMSEEVGVSFYRRINKWFSYVNVDNKRKYLGYFDNEQEAIDAKNKFVHINAA